MALVSEVRPRMTYADLEQLPDDGRRYELYDGEVRVVPSPIPWHQLVVDRFSDQLKAYRERFGGLLFMAPLDIVFSEFNTVQPDVVFFARGREQLINLRKTIRVAPDIAVEVLSPSTEAVDRGRKMQTFARFGVREYWIVDPDIESVELYHLSEAGYMLEQTASNTEFARSLVLPELTINVAALFAPIGGIEGPAKAGPLS
jgi:Uma2 family endonuclease